MYLLLAARDMDQIVGIGAAILAVIVLIVLFVIVGVFANYFRLWIQSFLTGAGITIWDLIGMTFRGGQRSLWCWRSQPAARWRNGSR